jgi:aspartyl protease family protein
LREVSIGGIVVRNVEALVIPGDGLAVNLLGMSFLGRLQKFESSGGRLVLIQ